MDFSRSEVVSEEAKLAPLVQLHPRRNGQSAHDSGDSDVGTRERTLFDVQNEELASFDSALTAAYATRFLLICDVEGSLAGQAAFVDGSSLALQ